jgi:MoxR-like ATPase
MAKKHAPNQPAPTHMQRPPAEVLHAQELARLATTDSDPRPPGWKLSPRAVRTFILGDAKKDISQKFVGNPSLVDRAMVGLATQRAVLLVGEPGTAKSLLSELLAAAISGRSTLTVQGSAATTEDQIKYGWNYALLLAEGPSPRALVPGPLYQAMKEGMLVRFEEITRCPSEIQDTLLSVLSDRVLTLPELEGDDTSLFAREGFNLIATANTRDRGTNEMSAALKRRFNFETVFSISDAATETALVERESARLLKSSGVPQAPPRDLLEVLITVFRDLRSGVTAEGSGMERLSTAMSTAEAVSVAHCMGIRAHYLGNGVANSVDLLESILGTVLKDNEEDLKRFRRYLEQRVIRRKGEHWVELFGARHNLP